MGGHAIQKYDPNSKLGHIRDLTTFFDLVPPISAHTNLNTDCAANRKLAFCMGSTRIHESRTDDTPPGRRKQKQKVPQKNRLNGKCCSNFVESSHS